MKIDKKLIDEILAKASVNERLRQTFDLRTSSADSSQRMLNVLLPGTVVPIHRHQDTCETVICLCGKLDEIIYEEVAEYINNDQSLFRFTETDNILKRTILHEVERIRLCSAKACYGYQVPKGVWHTVEILEPSVIFESKDGTYVPLRQEDVWNGQV